MPRLQLLPRCIVSAVLPETAPFGTRWPNSDRRRRCSSLQVPETAASRALIGSALKPRNECAREGTVARIIIEHYLRTQFRTVSRLHRYEGRRLHIILCY